MTDKSTITLEVTIEEREQLEALADRSGYPTIRDYLLALIHSELEAQDEDPIEGFREGWRDAMTGNTFPIETLWDNLGASDTTESKHQ